MPIDVLTSIDGAGPTSTVTVAWTLPSDTGSPITAYRVFLQEIDTGIYTEETIDCVGTDQTVIDNASCDVAVSTLLAAPYWLDGGDSVYAKVIAINVYGSSDISSEGNGAYYRRIPDVPVNLQEDISVRSASTDGLTWGDGVNNGGVPILDYKINQRVLGTTTYNMVGEFIATQSYTVTGLTLGVSYEFTVQARNEVGYSGMSGSTSFLHAIAPEVPAAPVTTNSGQDIIITWVAPYDSGAEITSYTIEIRRSDQAYSTTADCDGSDPVIVAATQCTVPLSTLTSAPFDLNSVGNPIVARIIATNIKDSSAHSSDGQGGIIIT